MDLIKLIRMISCYIKTENPRVYGHNSEAESAAAYVGGIFCDLEKAFECANHDLLMKELKFNRIVGNAYNLVQPYLSDRYQ
jgi:hypothetical protein